MGCVRSGYVRAALVFVLLLSLEGSAAYPRSVGMALATIAVSAHFYRAYVRGRCVFCPGFCVLWMPPRRSVFRDSLLKDGTPAKDKRSLPGWCVALYMHNPCHVLCRLNCVQFFVVNYRLRRGLGRTQSRWARIGSAGEVLYLNK